MRILYCITKANWGGAQRYVYDLALAARDAGHEVAVSYGERGLLEEKLREAGIRTIRVGALTRDVGLYREFAALGALRGLFRKERPDVVHLNSSKAAALGALAARIEHIPRIIYTAHGWAFNEARPLWQRLLLRMAAEATVYLAHQTICVSEAIRRDISPIAFATHKLVTIHNGITCSLLSSRVEARAKLLPTHAGAYWIGMVSELHPTKRVEDAIEAFALIAAKHPSAILVVCGEGRERAGLEGLIKKKQLLGRVFLLGLVPDAAQYLAAFDLFLHTPISEALGYVILEAGCARVPALATRVGGIPEIIEDGVSGLLAPPRSPALLSRALEQLMSEPAYTESLGERLRARVVRDFSQGEMVRKTLALYAPP